MNMGPQGSEDNLGVPAHVQAMMNGGPGLSQMGGFGESSEVSPKEVSDATLVFEHRAMNVLDER
jgi:hypothetical protein